MCICIHIYIYIYIYTRPGLTELPVLGDSALRCERDHGKHCSVCDHDICMCVYISLSLYIYMHTHYIYIYTYTWRVQHIM